MQKLKELEGMTQDALQKVPQAQDKVGMLQEYDIPHDFQGVQDLLEQVRSKYNDIMR